MIGQLLNVTVAAQLGAVLLGSDRRHRDSVSGTRRSAALQSVWISPPLASGLRLRDPIYWSLSPTSAPGRSSASRSSSPDAV
jgi:hypothetical protein